MRHETFSLNAPAAKKVQLVGNWLEQPVNMHRSENGVWETAVDLESGAYLYRFLMDGEWQDDPACKVKEPDPYGGHDSLREVP